MPQSFYESQTTGRPPHRLPDQKIKNLSHFRWFRFARLFAPCEMHPTADSQRMLEGRYHHRALAQHRNGLSRPANRLFYLDNTRMLFGDARDTTAPEQPSFWTGSRELSPSECLTGSGCLGRKYKWLSS